MLHLESRHTAIIRAILEHYVPGHPINAFGSRVTGTHHPASDLDLVIMSTTPVPFATLTRLREAFADSELPFCVDIVDWSALTPAFRLCIQQQAVPF